MKINLRCKCYELYDSIESTLAFWLSILTILVLSLLTDEVLIKVVLNLITLLLPSLIILIGFLLIGLLLLIPIVNDNLLPTVEREGHISSIKGILLSFYFLAVMLGISIVIMAMTYVMLNISNPILIYIHEFLLFYCIWFSILYMIGLIKTVVQLFYIIRLINKGEK